MGYILLVIEILFIFLLGIVTVNLYFRHDTMRDGSINPRCELLYFISEIKQEETIKNYARKEDETAENELKFSVNNSTTGKQLFDQVVNSIGLREIWFFGLEFTDTSGFTTWLKLNKKLTKQEIKKDNLGVLNFRFRIKYFPEDVEEINQDLTLRLLYLQVKESILLGEIFVLPDLAVLLASYAMYIKYGDYNKEEHKVGFLVNDRLLPTRVISHFEMDAEAREKRIMNLWAEHNGLSRERAVLTYLKIVQELDMYGVNYFEVRNKKGSDIYLGVHARGFNVYAKDDKLTPSISFSWPEIKHIKYNGKKFSIKHIGNKSNDLTCYVKHTCINKKIFGLSIGNHELSLRRRRPTPLQIQQPGQEEPIHTESRTDYAIYQENSNQDRTAHELTISSDEEIYHDTTQDQTSHEEEKFNDNTSIDKKRSMENHESSFQNRSITSEVSQSTQVKRQKSLLEQENSGLDQAVVVCNDVQDIPGEFVSSKTFTCGNRSIETVKYKVEKDGIIEIHVDHRVIIHSGEDIDYDEELNQAILEATRMNPNMMVEKIEMKQAAC